MTQEIKAFTLGEAVHIVREVLHDAKDWVLRGYTDRTADRLKRQAQGDILPEELASQQSNDLTGVFAGDFLSLRSFNGSSPMIPPHFARTLHQALATPPTETAASMRKQAQDQCAVLGINYLSETPQHPHPASDSLSPQS